MERISIIILFLLYSISTISQEKVDNDSSYIGKKASLYETAKDTDLKLSLTNDIIFEKSEQPLETEVCVFVNPNKTFQTILGLGGAITDASAEIFSKMSAEQQDEFLKAYYNKDEGIGYTLARTNIASCDFGSYSYNYVKEGDKELNTFDISHDKKLRIPMIKKAIEYAGGELPMFASPWSPPAFMKTNKNILQGGSLLPEYYQPWANYFVKFIQEYEKAGVPIYGVSIQNEPMAKQTWESCIYTAEQERDFLKYNLGPTMEKAGYSDKKIVVWDHNRDLINHRADVIFGDPEASKYAWGIGLHWYETWTGGTEMFDNVGAIYQAYPDKNIYFTEGCNEKFEMNKINYWPNAERYGNNLINDFNNGLMAYTDWNILLDERGGPNHVGNFCFAPVHFNTQTKEIIYTPTYYYIGHFSKFVRPNAKRVATNSSRSALLSTSFVNEDGKMVTVVMNKTDKEINYKLFVGNSMASVVIKPHSMQSIIY